MRLGGRCAGQLADQGHGFMAAGAQGQRRRQGWCKKGPQPVQQGEHASPLDLGGGAQEAEVADALQAPGQDVLEEAVQEAFGGELDGAPAPILTVLVGEGDRLAIVGEDALGAKGGAIDVSGEVLQGRLTGADGLNVGHPSPGPGGARDLDVELRVLLLQGLPEPGAKAQRQHGLGEEVALAFGADPAQAVGGEAAAGHYAMDVGMITQVARPGLEQGQEADLGSEIFVVASDIPQGAGAFLQEQRIKVLLVGPDHLPELGRDGEGDQVIGHGQQFASLAVEPLGGIGVAALGTGAVIAGVIGIVLLAAVALVELPAQGGGAAGQNGGDGAPMRGQEARAKLLLIRRPVPAQNCGQWDQGPSL